VSGPTPVPVVVGVGQVTHRDDENLRDAEPLALIAAAGRAADADSGGGVLAQVDGIELMPVGAWSYDDLGALVAQRLQVDVPRERRRIHPTGGETPLRALDDAAARIASGSARVVLVAGAESTRAVTRAQRAGVDVPWTPPGGRPSFPVFSADLRRASAIGFSRALNCFPLYEHGLRAHEGLCLAGAAAESAAMWAALARVAADNPYAWTRSGADARDVAAVGPTNRMVSYPYPKALTANPFVNQGAALLLTDTARALGVAEERWV
jgi:acetyl-CoA acetyltransferase